MNPLPCEWDEPLPRHEITHQLEPGDKHPTRKRTGMVIHVAPLFEAYPSGRTETHHFAYIVSDQHGGMIVKRLPEIRMVPCSTSTVRSAQPSLRFSGL